MNILILLAILFASIIVAMFLNRLVHCPLLVGFIFFSITLVVAVIQSNLTFVILAIILGTIAFLTSVLDCIFKSSSFFRNNSCISCNNPYEIIDNTNNNNNNNNNNNGNLRIINGEGEVIASINGNSVNCYDEDNNDNNSSCGCCSRSYRRR